MRATLALALLMLTACTVGPSYVPPQPAAPPVWLGSEPIPADTRESPDMESAPALRTNPAAAAANARGQIGAPWWALFDEPLLDGLMRDALARGFTVRQAANRIRAARAERASVRAGSLPAINAGFGASRQENVFPGFPNQQDFSLFDLGFDARWELDVFGRTERRVQAADARLSAATAARDAARLALTAEVARVFWQLRADEQLQNILLAERDLQAELLRLEERRYTVGTGTRAEVLHAAAELEQIEGRLVPAARAIVIDGRQLEQLLAHKPGALDAKLLTRSIDPTPSGSVLKDAELQALLDTPADALARRPDVRRAERLLAAATAMKGAAVADRYPRVSLALLAGLANPSIGALFSGASQALLAGGQVAAPIFDGGRLRAAVDMSDAAVADAALAWEETVLKVLHEVEVALNRLAAARAQEASLVRSAALSRELVRMASARHTRGAGDRLAVLEAKRAQRRIEAQQVEAQRESRTAVVALCKALGLGLGEVSVDDFVDPVAPVVGKNR